MKKKLLITGGSGLLGAYLVRWFALQDGWDVTATYQSSPDAVPEDIRTAAQWVSLTLPDKEAALDLVRGQTYVIHAAGKVSYHPKDKFRLLDIHQTGTAHVVDACLAHQVAHLIYIGSIGALGKEKSPAEVNESTPWMDNAYSTGYGLSKYLGELEAWRGAAEGLPASVVLPSVILGTGHTTRSSMHLLDRIAHKAPFYPDGQTGFVDVRDIARFVSCLLDQSNTGERWILSAANLSYKEVYEKIASRLGLKRRFRPAPEWLARTILVAGRVMGRDGMGTEILRQSYGRFSYDASKSLSVPGFEYKYIDQTLDNIADAYRLPALHPYLNF